MTQSQLLRSSPAGYRQVAGARAVPGRRSRTALPRRRAIRRKPVRFILPFGPGGVADATSRLVMEALGEKIGQRFVVENMPGAGGISAARAALPGR